MIDRLKGILSGIEADYADVRYEEKRETRIAYTGRALTETMQSTTDGYVVRVLRHGGFATVAFTGMEDAESAVRRAVENAALLGARTREPVALAPIEVASDRVTPDLDEDPAGVTLEEKVALLRAYNAIPLAHPKVATTSLAYGEIRRDKTFASTEGAAVEESLVTVRVSGGITATDGDLTQSVRVGFGGSDGFGRVRSREDMLHQRTGIAVDLLSAEPVAAGTYRAVLDPQMGGVFTHEAFGHFSEADLIEDSPTMRARMQVGARLGTETLSIRDDPTMPHQLGHYVYDDEGVRARPSQLMKEGVLTGRLHSRRTAAAFGEPVTGHCIAEDYRYAPIIRMGCIYIEPGEDTFDDLLARLGDGLYLVQNMGGQTSGQSFTFGANWGYRVEGGRRGKMIRDINISGDLYQTLESIEAVGDDLTLSQVGGCGKGQLNIRSCYGSPHILVAGVVIGGR